MKKFVYSARTKEGAIVKGQMEAKSPDSIASILLEQGLFVVSIKEKVGFDLESLSQINIGGIPLAEKVVFMRQLSTMITAGLSLARSLSILEKQMLNPKFKKIVGEIVGDLEGGMSFASALKRNSDVFDEVTISLIAAGEESGHLDEILQRLALEMEKKKKLDGKIKGAFMYPLILVLIVIGVVILLLTVLVPTLKTMFETSGAALPAITQFLIDSSNNFLKYWWAILIGISIVSISIKAYLDTPNGKSLYSRYVLKIPIFGVYIAKIQIAQFTRVLSLLLKSGLSITQALILTSDALSNLVFRNAVVDAKNEVEKGVSLAVPISRYVIFPIIVSQMIAIGEETGKLDEILGKLAEYYEDEVEVMTSTISTLLEPIILVVMGGMIGFIAIAVYSPMLSITSAF